jgi:hypothetical protein
LPNVVDKTKKTFIFDTEAISKAENKMIGDLLLENQMRMEK